MTIDIKWHPPQKGWYKLNVDGAHDNLKSGIGGVFRSCSGKWIIGFQKKTNAIYPLHAELQSLQEGLKLAHRFMLFPLEIETDSTDVIKAIENGHATLNNVIFFCRSLMFQLKDLVLRHNFRERNRVTDALAKDAKNEDDSKNMHEEVKVLVSPPVFVEKTLANDMSGDPIFSKNVSSSICINAEIEEGDGPSDIPLEMQGKSSTNMDALCDRRRDEIVEKYYHV
ncbi:PREDICTED: uncharacterized protein LOC109215848 [Nicotiana attenuata]|uniref:uncharacterized protein LOC109215848 n=1 Tax=Nicotiana attenuata TaxID=49451 RepID=UPI000904B36E|nr:PREDICTED: uncharacterized protein LOC109215848 [Nicotiana attenuata]